MPALPAPPSNLSVDFHATDNDSLVVGYTHNSSTQRFYQFELHYRLAGSITGDKVSMDTDSNPVEFDNRSYGLWYKARGRNCRTSSRTSCGAWSGFSAELFLGPPPTPPAITSIAVDPADAEGDRLVVDYTHSTSSQRFYQIELHGRFGGSGTGGEAATESALSPPVEFDGLSYGLWYKARGRNCRTSSRTNCGAWSSFSAETFLLARPANLDVKPLPLRKAELSWGPVAGADQYEVEIQAPGGTWASPHATTTTTTSYTIALDSILPGRGLGDAPYAYEFRVTAKRQAIGGAYTPDSRHSDVVTIIDTPITKADGDSREMPEGEGWANLEWTQVSTLTILGPSYAGGSYSFRYRKLGLHTLIRKNMVIDVDHTDYEWKPTNPGPNQTASTSPITGLELEEIYAIQLRYETATHRVYAARDVYVWPSKGSAWNERVASFPLIHPLKDKTYAYRVCEETFPGGIELTNGEKANPGWRNAIEHALERWDLATAGLVATTLEAYTADEVSNDPELNDDMKGRSKPCAVYSDEFIEALADRIATEYPEAGPGNELTPGRDGQIAELRKYLDALDDLTNIRAEDGKLSEIKMVDVDRYEGYMVGGN